MEGGKENQQAHRGRNRRACLETVWADQEIDMQKGEGAGGEHCKGSEARIEALAGVQEMKA